MLTGPTASGKSALGMELAEKHGWDILCMDSMQIYRRMDIGTAKPTPEERRRVPHYLLDILEPKETFSASAYREMAEKLIREKEQEGKEVLLVGGTGLYLQALTQPMSMGMVPPDENLRAEMRTLAASPEGKRELHRMLEELDPETAERLPLNDTRRVIRAIEVTRGSGIPFSQQPRREVSSDFEWRIAAMEMPRETLYERINRRVDAMIGAGLVEEVRGLINEGVPADAQSMQGLGYKEMLHYIRGEWNLEMTAEEIRKGSRHYAKRQGTFLRRMQNIQPVEALRKDALEQAEDILV